jgi:hypothetical protein
MSVSHEVSGLHVRVKVMPLDVAVAFFQSGPRPDLITLR